MTELESYSATQHYHSNNVSETKIEQNNNKDRFKQEEMRAGSGDVIQNEVQPESHVHEFVVYKTLKHFSFETTE